MKKESALQKRKHKRYYQQYNAPILQQIKDKIDLTGEIDLELIEKLEGDEVGKLREYIYLYKKVKTPQKKGFQI